jgi:hypothetical protein
VQKAQSFAIVAAAAARGWAARAANERSITASSARLHAPACHFARVERWCVRVESVADRIDNRAP